MYTPRLFAKHEDRRAMRLPTSVILMLSAAVIPAHAEILSDHDNGPFAGIFGYPDATEGGQLLKDGSSQVSVRLLAASHSVVELSGNETFVLDGETVRAELNYSRALSDRLEFGIELPFVSHATGGLDSVIDQWHDFFGLPDGPRATRPRDLLQYSFDNGTDDVFFDENSSGLGDVRLTAGWRLSADASKAVALRFGLKLPTGDPDAFLGSGGVDASIGIAGDTATLLGNERLSGFYRIHAIYLGEPDPLGARHRSVVGQAAGGVTFQINNVVGLNLQATLRSAAYDARIDELGGASIALTFGGSVRLGRSTTLLLGVGEDIKVGSAPDVTFQLGVRYQAR